MCMQIIFMIILFIWIEISECQWVCFYLFWSFSIIFHFQDQSCYDAISTIKPEFNDSLQQQCLKCRSEISYKTKNQNVVVIVSIISTLGLGVQVCLILVYIRLKSSKKRKRKRRRRRRIPRIYLPYFFQFNERVV